MPKKDKISNLSPQPPELTLKCLDWQVYSLLQVRQARKQVTESHFLAGICLPPGPAHRMLNHTNSLCRCAQLHPKVLHNQMLITAWSAISDRLAGADQKTCLAIGSLVFVVLLQPVVMYQTQTVNEAEATIIKGKTCCCCFWGCCCSSCCCCCCSCCCLGCCCCFSVSCTKQANKFYALHKAFITHNCCGQEASLHTATEGASSFLHPCHL